MTGERSPGAEPARLVLPRLACAALVLVAVGIAWGSSSALPDSVASNFGSDGRPTSFAAHETYRWFASAATLLVPLVVYAGTVWVPRLPPRRLWIPNSEHWLAPERRAASYATLERFGLATSALVTLFALALHAAIVRANRLSPPTFERGPGRLLLGAWLAFVLTTVVLFHRRFRAPRPEPRER